MPLLQRLPNEPAYLCPRGPVIETRIIAIISPRLLQFMIAEGNQWLNNAGTFFFSRQRDENVGKEDGNLHQMACVWYALLYSAAFCLEGQSQQMSTDDLYYFF